MSNGSTTASVVLRVFDGTRQPFPSGSSLLVTVFNDNQSIWHQNSFTVSNIQLQLPFHDGPGDNYSITVWTHGRRSAGFFPVKANPTLTQNLDVMLIPDDARFRFNLDFPDLAAQLPQTANLFKGDASDADAQDRYEGLRDGSADQQKALACFFNLTTAMYQIHLPQGTPMDYMKQVIWDNPTNAFAQDRFFAFADRGLIDQVKQAADQGIFAKDPAPGAFHPGATLSYKQIQFGEANVQLTFHENDPAPNPNWVKVEPDIDYFKDIAAHAIMEVIVNKVTHSLTDPRIVYVLRWIAGRRKAGIPEFNPPYFVV